MCFTTSGVPYQVRSVAASSALLLSALFFIVICSLFYHKCRNLCLNMYGYSRGVVWKRSGLLFCLSSPSLDRVVRFSVRVQCQHETRYRRNMTVCIFSRYKFYLCPSWSIHFSHLYQFLHFDSFRYKWLFWSKFTWMSRNWQLYGWCSWNFSLRTWMQRTFWLEAVTGGVWNP